MWHLGSSVDILPIIERRLAAGDDPAPFRRALAFQALAARDFTGAAELLQAACVQAPQDRFLEQCLFFSLCMAGRDQEARELAAARMAPRGVDDGDRAFWRWAQESMGVAPPPLASP
jgi:hypothetical protein